MGLSAVLWEARYSNYTPNRSDHLWRWSSTTWQVLVIHAPCGISLEDPPCFSIKKILLPKSLSLLALGQVTCVALEMLPWLWKLLNLWKKNVLQTRKPWEMLSQEEESWILKDCKCKRVETFWHGVFGYSILWLIFFKENKKKSRVTNYTYYIEPCKRSSEIFADFSYWVCCLNCNVCTQQRFTLPT